MVVMFVAVVVLPLIGQPGIECLEGLDERGEVVVAAELDFSETNKSFVLIVKQFPATQGDMKE